MSYTYKDCTPKKIWVIIRHGSRFPTGKELEKMQKLNPLKEMIMANYKKPEIKRNVCRLCDADYQLLKNWQWHENLTVENSNRLAEKVYNLIRLFTKFTISLTKKK